MLKTFLKGILAGIAISLGSWLNLRANAMFDNTLIGSLLFTIGLILICNFDFFLYTGKVCYLYEDHKKENFLRLLLGLIGNAVGCLIMGLLLRAAFIEESAALFTSLDSMVAHKIDSVWYLKGIKSFFCGMLVFLAVDGFKKIENNFGKYVVLVLCISGFIFAGFEHCVANMFYFALAKSFTLQTLGSLLLCILFNSLGGLFIPTINWLIKKTSKAEK